MVSDIRVTLIAAALLKNDPTYVRKVAHLPIKSHLPSKLTELLYILKTTYHSEKVRFTKVTHYFYFMSCTQGK